MTLTPCEHNVLIDILHNPRATNSQIMKRTRHYSPLLIVQAVTKLHGHGMITKSRAGLLSITEAGKTHICNSAAWAEL